MQQRLKKSGKNASNDALDGHGLERERARLENEVLQLRAAAKIWTEVCHRLAERGRSASNQQRINVG